MTLYTDNERRASAEEIDLWTSLEQEWIKMLLPAARDVGPASQTLGGLLAITNRETFSFRSSIAEKARLPLRTTAKHLDTLAARGWIVNAGRQRTRAGRLRKSATLKITKQTRAAMNDYALLPWWAACFVRHHGKMSWSARVVLSVLMSRLCSLKKVVEEDESGEDWGEDWGEAIQEYGEDRFRFSLKSLEKITGLAHHSLIAAKRQLHNAGIIKRFGQGDAGSSTDLLLPNSDFAVVVSPAESGRCWLDFRGGAR